MKITGNILTKKMKISIELILDTSALINIIP